MVAFALHLCAIARFYNLDDTLFWSISPISLIVLRGLGVVLILLLFVQSLRKTGPDTWRFLTSFGSYYIWAAFFAGFAKRIVLDQFYLLPVALDGIQFAVVMKGGLHLRVDDVNRPSLEAANARPFTYPGRSRAVSVAGYYEVPDEIADDPDELLAWAQQAHRECEKVEPSTQALTFGDGDPI